MAKDFCSIRFGGKKSNVLDVHDFFPTKRANKKACPGLDPGTSQMAHLFPEEA